MDGRGGVEMDCREVNVGGRSCGVDGCGCVVAGNGR